MKTRTRILTLNHAYRDKAGYPILCEGFVRRYLTDTSHEDYPPEDFRSPEKIKLILSVTPLPGSIQVTFESHFGVATTELYGRDRAVVYGELHRLVLELTHTGSIFQFYLKIQAL